MLGSDSNRLFLIAESDYPMALRTLSPVNSLFTGSVSMLANLILLLLIYSRTSKELRVYSRILIQNCVVDMCYTATVLLTEAVSACEFPPPPLHNFLAMLGNEKRGGGGLCGCWQH